MICDVSLAQQAITLPYVQHTLSSLPKCFFSTATGLITDHPSELLEKVSQAQIQWPPLILNTSYLDLAALFAIGII